jgi:hypothetical protein
MNDLLLTRDQFREAVFTRDGNRCVICRKEAQDAHHILERRLFPDGGYYLSNGASVCAEHHIQAEQTTLSCDDLRRACGIESVCLPPHLYSDIQYDKWGNPILETGRRLKGELFEDASVQKILAQGHVLSLFDDHVKYPRTWHLPWSPGVTKDDRVQHDLSGFVNVPLVITEKMDGENTTLYRDYIHARSLEYNSHPSRNWVKKLHNEKGFDIPRGWRVCGENLYAKHSIKYTDLASYFQVFSVWNEHNICLSWDETEEWAKLLGFETVPWIAGATIFELKNVESIIKHNVMAYQIHIHNREMEGYTVRLANEFSYRDFSRSILKYVRHNHVQTHGHWMRSLIEVNELRTLIPHP